MSIVKKTKKKGKRKKKNKIIKEKSFLETHNFH